MKCERIHNTENDLMVVNAARVSFNKHKNTFDEADEGLIRYLAEHNHFTPFTHCRETFMIPVSCFRIDWMNETDLAGMVMDYGVSVNRVKVRTSIYGWANAVRKGILAPASATFITRYLSQKYPVSWKYLVKDDQSEVMNNTSYVGVEEDPRFIDVTFRETVPIFVARQRMKHMVGFTYNEVSRRYVDDTPLFFEPTWRTRAPTKKQGSGPALQNGFEAARILNTTEDVALKAYQDLLSLGVAPEQARMVLPQSMYTSYYVTGSVAAFRRAYKLRSDEHAQQEIRELAEYWREL